MGVDRCRFVDSLLAERAATRLYLYKGQAGLRWAAAGYTQAFGLSIQKSPFFSPLQRLKEEALDAPIHAHNKHSYHYTSCVITLHVTCLGWVGIHRR